MAASDPAALTFLTMTTRTTYCAEFTTGEGSKTAVSIGRWVTRRGATGAWSETSSATVAA